MTQCIKADWDEVLFEQRQRSYGAYLLRKSYPKHLFKSSCLVLLSFLLVSVIPVISKSIIGTENRSNEDGRKVVIDAVPPPSKIMDEKPLPPSIPKLPPPKLKTITFTIPTPTSKEELTNEEQESTVTEMSELLDAPVIGLVDIEGSASGFSFEEGIEGEGQIPVVIKEEEPQIDSFIIPEEEPVPFNLDEVKRSIKYPQVARDAHIEGPVVVRILIDKNGNYVRHKVLISQHPILTAAIEEKLSKLRFTPAIQGGKPIMFWVNVPFGFKLME